MRTRDDLFDLQSRLATALEDDSALAWSLGDVLQVTAGRTALRSHAGSLVQGAVRLLQSRTRAESPADVTAGSPVSLLALSAGHDARSVLRVDRLASRVQELSGGAAVSHVRIGKDSPGLGWSARATTALPDLSPKARQHISKACRSALHGSRNKAMKHTLERWLTVQARRVRAAGDFLERTGTRALVVDYCRGMPLSPFVIAAHDRGMHTISLVHGDPNQASYANPLAQRLLYWSEQQKRTVQSWSEGRADGWVVGNFWSPSPDAQRPRTSRHAVILLSGVTSARSQLATFAPAAQALRAQGWTISARAHPLSRLQSVPSRFRGPLSSPQSLEHILSLAGLTLSAQSTGAVDSLAAGCPTAFPPSTTLTASFADVEPGGPDLALPAGWRVFAPQRSAGWPLALSGELSRTASAEAVYRAAL